MYQRHIKEWIIYGAQKFPIVTLVGPRQSGKTTLARSLFPEKKYITLEDLDQRRFATEDPRGFLATYNQGVIIDEIQHAPTLFSYLQSHVDEHARMGEFILTGSQHFLLTEKISQSLAGRTAIFELLPCTLKEINLFDKKDPFDAIFKGFYPAIHAREIDPTLYYKSYVNTYIERDVRTLSMVKDLSKFRVFLQLCAGRVGQLLNISSLGNDCGIDQGTVRSWLSILSASYILFLLKPHYKNFNKRLTKQPKIYFYDTGLASFCLDVNDSKSLNNHYAKGALFENFVAVELIKNNLNKGKDANLFFWRDHHGHEVDFIKETSQGLLPIEVKAGKTFNPSFLEGLDYWNHLARAQKQALVYGGTEYQQRQNNTQIFPWFDADLL